MTDNMSTLSRHIVFCCFFALISCCISCNSNKQVVEKDVTNQETSSIYNDKVTVIAKPEVMASTLEKRFDKYALKYKGLTSKSQNKMIFTFDNSSISNAELCKLLKKDDDIIEATSLEENVKKTGLSRSSVKQTARPTK